VHTRTRPAVAPVGLRRHVAVERLLQSRVRKARRVRYEKNGQGQWIKDWGEAHTQAVFQGRRQPGGNRARKGG
jgi:hypothetical protein